MPHPGRPATGASGVLFSRPTSAAPAQQLGQLAGGIDADQEAAMLFFMIQGLIGPILIGILTPGDALALVDHQLDRIFQS